MDKKLVIDMLKKYTSVVIWGLHTPTNSTQRHVHRHLFTVLGKIGVPVIWCDDLPDNNIAIPKGSLVFCSCECCQFIQYRKSDWYVMYHTAERIENCQNYIRLFLYGELPIEDGSTPWSKVVYFNKAHHMLYQTLVTDLLPEEFLPPIFSEGSRTVIWVGSIWNDQNNHGNIRTIHMLSEALKRKGLAFERRVGVSDEENVALMRSSRIAPSIGGDFQSLSMLPCRIWKNISYGQMGVTNLIKSEDIFGCGILCDTNIDNLIDKALRIQENEYVKSTLEQQKVVAEEYTYLNFLYNIGRSLEELGIQ